MEVVRITEDVFTIIGKIEESHRLLDAINRPIIYRELEESPNIILKTLTKSKPLVKAIERATSKKVIFSFVKIINYSFDGSLLIDKLPLLFNNQGRGSSK